MHRARLEHLRRYLSSRPHIKNVVFAMLAIIVVLLFSIVLFTADAIKREEIRDNAVNFCNTYLADKKLLEKYETITMVFQDKKQNYYVFTYKCDSAKLYECKGNYDQSYNGEVFSRIPHPGCRYDADELLKLTCGDKVDTTDISDDIFGTEKKPKNVVRIIAGELKASLKKEISLSR